MSLCAIRTLAFDYEGNIAHDVSGWQCYRRNVNILNAERLMTCFAVEMNMVIAVMARVGMVAKFVIDNSPAVYKRVNDILFCEELNDAEDARFIQCT